MAFKKQRLPVTEAATGTHTLSLFLSHTHTPTYLSAIILCYTHIHLYTLALTLESRRLCLKSNFPSEQRSHLCPTHTWSAHGQRLVGELDLIFPLVSPRTTSPDRSVTTFGIYIKCNLQGTDSILWVIWKKSAAYTVMQTIVQYAMWFWVAICGKISIFESLEKKKIQ